MNPSVVQIRSNDLRGIYRESPSLVDFVSSKTKRGCWNHESIGMSCPAVAEVPHSLHTLEGFWKMGCVRMYDEIHTIKAPADSIGLIRLTACYC